jgi:hypothetical protein
VTSHLASSLQRSGREAARKFDPYEPRYFTVSPAFHPVYSHYGLGAAASLMLDQTKVPARSMSIADIELIG